MTHSGFLIAATSSGCGKTTLSLGLMRALAARGFAVQPFKCGPDYIDTQFHAMASGRPSINLDTFMASERHVSSLFSEYSAESDVAVVEGVMGMLDGYQRMKGSCAELAVMLGIPVVLLVNAASTAYSVAATIYGFKNFYPAINMAGVIFNRVASPSHYSFLKDACHDAGVECLGFISRNERLVTPSRHLGLTLGAAGEMEKYIGTAADAVNEGIDLDRLLSLTSIPPSQPRKPSIDKPGNLPSLKIAVARDEAFNFIYPINIRSLIEHPRYNVAIDYFSPLADSKLPDADMLYLPGGYPELFAEKLEKNSRMRDAIRGFALNDGKIIAECGGMIYLGDELDGRRMCGVLPLTTSMENARLHLGYRIIETGGLELRGHEFHYSEVTDDSRAKKLVARQINSRGKEVDTPIYRYKNVIAGYTHLYWPEKDILKLFDS